MRSAGLCSKTAKRWATVKAAGTSHSQQSVAAKAHLSEPPQAIHVETSPPSPSAWLAMAGSVSGLGCDRHRECGRFCKDSVAFKMVFPDKCSGNARFRCNDDRVFGSGAQLGEANRGSRRDSVARNGGTTRNRLDGISNALPLRKRKTSNWQVRGWMTLTRCLLKWNSPPTKPFYP